MTAPGNPAARELQTRIDELIRLLCLTKDQRTYAKLWRRLVAMIEAA